MPDSLCSSSIMLLVVEMKQSIVSGDPPPTFAEGVGRQIVSGDPPPTFAGGVGRQIVSGDPPPLV